MPIACPTCAKLNPAGATYCHYDGRALAHVGTVGPWGLGTKPFQAPFSFSDGLSCGNFNQLALACDSRWNEARGFLADGIWCSFFGKIGRHDLALAAVQAAKEADRDVGLAYLLERLPTDALRQPTLGVPSVAEDLGTLEPGNDRKFEVVVSNRGSLILHGSMVTDCEWLFFGDRQGNLSRKLFRTRDNYTLSVTVVGGKLRAGQKALEGKIEIETNGGNSTVVVRAKVPIRPFPKGQYGDNVLAGARSPREVAVKAKAHPQEAGALFEQGAVSAWYASNGWAYPIQGTQGRGKAAVQQFFEALGLTKPPHLELGTERIVCRGEAGRRLTKHVTVSTKESKFVNAEAHSDQGWVKVQPGHAQGNQLEIPLVIEIPPRPGESLHASVTVRGSGQQRFVVPVTLTVEAARPAEEEEDETPARDGNPWLLAGVAGVLLLLLSAGAYSLVRNHQATTAPPSPIDPPPIEVANTGTPKAEAWWFAIPDQKLASSASELRGILSGDSGAIFEEISTKADTGRFKAYEQLGKKLPGLMDDAKAREPLSRFLTECIVHEPSELNISQLRPGLIGLFPNAGDAFRPEAKGREVENALLTRQIIFDAMRHKAVKPARGGTLAGLLNTAFGASLDTAAPPDELRAETTKRLALRCYRNTLPTARQSPAHALDMRAALIEKFPEQLPPDVRVPIDAELLLAVMAKGDEEHWPKLEPVFASCLASDDVGICLKVVAVYAKANAALAKKMEELMAPKWKVAAAAKLSQADKAAKIQEILKRDKPQIPKADRLGRFRKSADAALASAVKPGKKSELDHLMHAVRLAHSSTMGSILYRKDDEVERFDELIGRVPGAEAADKPKAADEPKPPAEGEAKVINAEGQPYAVAGELTKKSDRDPKRGTFRKEYSVSMQAGQTYTINLQSTDFNSYLRLESGAGRQEAVADNNGTANARITYQPRAGGIYRVIATTSVKGATGAFTLRVQKAGGMGNFGFGMPFPRGGPFGPRFGPANPFLPVVPEQPKAAPQATDDVGSRVSASDLASLGSTKRDVRVTAFTNLAGNLPKELKARDAEKIARYLLSTTASDAEIEEASGKLESLATCRNLLPALADAIAGNDKVTQQRAEAVVGAILGQRLRFEKDDDWRSASRKLLLQRTLDLTLVSAKAAPADSVAEFLRDLYKEQGLAFGVEGDEFLQQTQPTRVLEDLIRHVAARVPKKGMTPAEQEYLGQIDRHLKAAQFVSDNPLENMVLLQRIWIEVLTSQLRESVPDRAEGMRKLRQELADSDRDSRNVFDQLRVAEEKILRVWLLAHAPNKSRGG